MGGLCGDNRGFCFKPTVGLSAQSRQFNFRFTSRLYTNPPQYFSLYNFCGPFWVTCEKVARLAESEGLRGESCLLRNQHSCQKAPRDPFRKGFLQILSLA